MSPPDKSKLIDKIVKLFNLGSGDANTTEAEMMAATTRARTLMVQHNISMVEIEMAKGKSAAQAMEWTINRFNAYTRKGTLADYDQHLAWAVATLTETRPILSTRKSSLGKYTSMVFVGTPEESALAGQLFLIWLQEVRRMARSKYGGGKNNWTRQHTAYCVGVADRLQSRAREKVRGLTPDQEQTFALIVRSKSTAIDSYLGDIKQAKEKKMDLDMEAYFEGLADGEKFNMATKVIR